MRTINIINVGGVDKEIEDTVARDANTTQSSQIQTLTNNLATTNNNLATTNNNLASEVSARSSADTLINTRIDEIIAPSGEAPSAAEVTDARIGVNGVTYNTLGDAIRGQVTGLKNNIDSYITNAMDNITIIDGEYINSSHYVTRDAKAKRTDYIPVCEGETIHTFAQISNGAYEVAFYDINKTFISNGSILGDGTQHTRDIVIPNGVAYIIVSTHSLTAGANGNVINVYRDINNDNDYSQCILKDVIKRRESIYTCNNVGYYTKLFMLEPNHGYHSDMIPVIAGETLTYRTLISNAGLELMFLSANKLPLQASVVGTSQNEFKTVTVPSNACYVVLSDFDARNAFISFGTIENENEDVAFFTPTIVGYVNASGVINPNENAVHTDYIPINNGVIIEYSSHINNLGYEIAVFDAGKKCIGGVLGDDETVLKTYKINDVNARYVVFSCYNYNGCMTIYKNENIKSYFERMMAFNGGNNTFSIFRKFCVIGDSLSVGHIDVPSGTSTSPNYDYCWVQFMARKYASIGINCGFSGATAESWLNNVEGLTKLNMPVNKSQAYIVALGANEQTANIGDPSTINDTTTFYGAYKAIYDAIRNVNSDAKVFFFTLATDWGVSYADVNEAIEYIAENYGDSNTFVVDLHTLYKNLFTTYPIAIAQNTHYFPSSYAMIANILEYALDKVIINNPRVFANVHEIDYAQ